MNHYAWLLFLTALGIALARDVGQGFSPLIDYEEEIESDLLLLWEDIYAVRRPLDSPWDKFMYAFERSALKTQFRKGQSCFTDGLALLSGLREVHAAYKERPTMDVFYNLNDVFVGFNTKCNFVDTLQGTIFLNSLAFLLEPVLYIGAVAVRALDASSLLMDIADIGFGLRVLKLHSDVYNWGFLAGKAAKLLTQAYMRGWL